MFAITKSGVGLKPSVISRWDTYEKAVEEIVNFSGQDISSIQKDGRRATIESMITDGCLVVRVVDAKNVITKFVLGWEKSE